MRHGAQGHRCPRRYWTHGGVRASEWLRSLTQPSSLPGISFSKAPPGPSAAAEESGRAGCYGAFCRKVGQSKQPAGRRELKSGLLPHRAASTGLRDPQPQALQPLPHVCENTANSTSPCPPESHTPLPWGPAGFCLVTVTLGGCCWMWFTQGRLFTGQRPCSASGSF